MPRGRKKSPNSKTDILTFRMRPAEKRDLTARVTMSGMDVSGYIRALIELDKREGFICKY